MFTYAATIYLLFLKCSLIGDSITSGAANIDEMLFHLLIMKEASSMDRISKRDTGFLLDNLKETAKTFVLKRVGIKSIEEVVKDLVNECKFPIHGEKVALLAKHAMKTDKSNTELVFEIGRTGRFLYSKILTMKRENGNEIDMIFATYEVTFTLSKTVTENKVARLPFVHFFLGHYTEYKEEDRNLLHEEKEQLQSYLSMLATQGLLRRYVRQPDIRWIKDKWNRRGSISI